MAAQPSTEDSFTFVGGLNSEGGFFITPKNTWKDGDNIIPNTDGSIQRRKAIDYEDSYVLYDPDTNGGAVGPGGAAGTGPGGVGGDGYIGYSSGEGFSLTMPAGYLAGDTLVAIIYSHTTAVPTFASSWEDGGPYIGQESSSGSRTHVFFRTATGTAADSVATFTVAGSSMAIWTVLAVRGIIDADYPSAFSGSGNDYSDNREAGTYNSGTNTKSAGNHFTLSIAFGLAPFAGGAEPTAAPSGMTLADITLSSSFTYGTAYKLALGVAYAVYNGTTYNANAWTDNGGSSGTGGNGAMAFTITYDPLESANYIPADDALLSADLGAYSVSNWKSINGNGELELLVAQAGPTIHFYSPTSGAVSAAKKTFTINLGDYVAFGNTEVIGNSVITIANCYGKLLITSKDTDPIIVTYDEATDTISVIRLELRIRDFVGIRSPVQPQIEYTEAEWEALTPPFGAAAKYNLYNQGWANTQIDAYKTANTDKLPANTKQWIYGKDTSDNFDTTVLAKQDFGTSNAPRGRFILKAFYQDRATALDSVEDTTSQTPVVPTDPNYYQNDDWANPYNP